MELPGFHLIPRTFFIFRHTWLSIRGSRSWMWLSDMSMYWQNTFRHWKDTFEFHHRNVHYGTPVDGEISIPANSKARHQALTFLLDGSCWIHSETSLIITRCVLVRLWIIRSSEEKFLSLESSNCRLPPYTHLHVLSFNSTCMFNLFVWNSREKKKSSSQGPIWKCLSGSFFKSKW